MWYYNKCVIKKNGNIPGRSRKAPKLWTLSYYETGYCISRHKTFKKAVNAMIRFQRKQDFK